MNIDYTYDRYEEVLTQEGPQGPKFYYDAIHGMVLNDGKTLSRDDVALSFDPSPGNATYLGFKNGKHHVNFNIEDFEITKGNIRALMIHEIFLGHVFEVGDSTYRIKVMEWYKGEFLEDTLTGMITQRVMTPKTGSIWLIFGKKQLGDKFLADVCSGSKSLSSPHGTHDITFPEVPPPDVFKNPSQLFLTKQIVLDKALNEFYFDLPVYGQGKRNR